MTKIKNTKKGMAKKTLSISLAVAMLATSNVPVWAAEFTDGTDAAFTSEAPAEEVVTDAEAPVVEDEAPVEKSTVTEASDVVANLKITDKAVFGIGRVNVSGTVNYKEDDGTLVELKDYSFGWREAGKNINIVSGEVKNGKTETMSFDVDNFAELDMSAYAGKKLELFIYKNEEAEDININPLKVGETFIEKCDLTGAKVQFTRDYTG